MQDRPTLFLEVIQRHNHSVRVCPGHCKAGGRFGAIMVHFKLCTKGNQTPNTCLVGSVWATYKSSVNLSRYILKSPLLLSLCCALWHLVCNAQRLQYMSEQAHLVTLHSLQMWTQCMKVRNLIWTTAKNSLEKPLTLDVFVICENIYMINWWADVDGSALSRPSGGFEPCENIYLLFQTLTSKCSASRAMSGLGSPWP